MEEETKQEATRRIRNSMAHIQQAMAHVEDSAIGIHCICGEGMADEWIRLCKLYDSVKANWYRLQDKLLCGQFDLDDMAAASFIQKQRVN